MFIFDRVIENYTLILKNIEEWYLWNSLCFLYFNHDIFLKVHAYCSTEK